MESDLVYIGRYLQFPWREVDRQWICISAVTLIFSSIDGRLIWGGSFPCPALPPFPLFGTLRWIASGSAIICLSLHIGLDLLSVMMVLVGRLSDILSRYFPRIQLIHVQRQKIFPCTTHILHRALLFKLQRCQVILIENIQYIISTQPIPTSKMENSRAYDDLSDPLDTNNSQPHSYIVAILALR